MTDITRDAAGDCWAIIDEGGGGRRAVKGLDPSEVLDHLAPADFPATYRSPYREAHPRLVVTVQRMTDGWFAATALDSNRGPKGWAAPTASEAFETAVGDLYQADEEETRRVLDDLGDFFGG